MIISPALTPVPVGAALKVTDPGAVDVLTELMVVPVPHHGQLPVPEVMTEFVLSVTSAHDPVLKAFVVDIFADVGELPLAFTCMPHSDAV